MVRWNIDRAGPSFGARSGDRAAHATDRGNRRGQAPLQDFPVRYSVMAAAFISQLHDGASRSFRYKNSAVTLSWARPYGGMGKASSPAKRQNGVWVFQLAANPGTTPFNGRER